MLQFAARLRRGVVGIVGVTFLVWSLIGTIQKVEDSFNYVWRVPQARSLGRRLAEFLSLLVVGPVLVGGFIALSHTAFIAGPVQLASSLTLVKRLLSLGLHLAPYLMVTTLFTFLYMFIPNTRVRFTPALIGALVAGVLWAAVGSIFTRFVEYSARLTLVYAGFAAVIAVVTWTYFGWLILLSGAQLSFYIQNPSYLRFGMRAAETVGGGNRTAGADRQLPGGPQRRHGPAPLHPGCTRFRPGRHGRGTAAAGERARTRPGIEGFRRGTAAGA